jgi:hypothetical protein
MSKTHTATLRTCPSTIPVDNFGPYPGYFTEQLITHNFPPDWEPCTDFGQSAVLRSEAAVRGREVCLANGHTGSIVGISKKADDGVAGYKAVNEAKRRRTEKQ